MSVFLFERGWLRLALSDILTAKQQSVLQSYLHDDWRLMILNGAVRSGKTYIDNWLFLMELRRVSKLAKQRGIKNPLYILAGFSSNSIYTNVIASFYDQFGIELKPDRHGHYHFMNVEIIPSYTGTERGVNSIRGATVFGSYINECSLATQPVFQEILQRCSVEGSRIICDTNP